MAIYDIPSPYLELLTGLIGLCVGSFLNVVALRSLAEKSILTPSSHCPKCEHKLGILDLVPFLSYVALGANAVTAKSRFTGNIPWLNWARQWLLF